MKTTVFTRLCLILTLIFSATKMHAQFPQRVLVGYYENWNGDVKLKDIHESYNVINIAFAVPKLGSTCELIFDVPTAYASLSEFITELDYLHSKNKVVLMSIGGATGEVALETVSDKNKFVASVKSIFSQHNYKLDGIDIDVEAASVQGDVSTWTMTNPSNRQKYLIDAIKELMADYKSHTNKKMCLTMAPEVAYVQGGLSSYQVSSINGGWYLVLIENLREELDMLNCQLYNVYGEAYAIDYQLHMEGSGNFIVAMTETAIKGFVVQNFKGVYKGLPANKVGFGTVGNNSCATYNPASLISPDEIVTAIKYIRGKVTKPNGWQYTCTASYPSLRGMMVWSINKDYNLDGTGICDNGAWNNAKIFDEAFPPNENVAVDEKLNTTKWNLYPTLANDKIFVENKGDEAFVVVLLNELGMAVQTVVLQSGINNISTDELEAGVYFLQVKEDVRKIVIQH